MNRSNDCCDINCFSEFQQNYLHYYFVCAHVIYRYSKELFRL